MSEHPQVHGPILCVVGARPNFMKMAPLLRALSAQPQLMPPVLVHTGQHYDAAMSEQLFVGLGLPAPDINLDVGSGTHAVQTAEIMRRFEPVVDTTRPELRRRGRRRQLDARVQPGRRQEGHPGGARRGGAAQLRSHDAGGDQPAADRPDGGPALHDGTLRRGKPAAGGDSRREDPFRRQCHDRFVGRQPRACGGTRGCSRPPRHRCFDSPGRIRFWRRHPPPAVERGSEGGSCRSAGDSAGSERDASAGLSAASADAGQHRALRPRGGRRYRRASSCCRPRATWRRSG